MKKLVPQTLKRISMSLCVFFLLLLSTQWAYASPPQKRFYVTMSGGAGSKSGLTWAAAEDSTTFYGTGTKSLSNAVAGDTFWLKTGTYHPNLQNSGNAFTIPYGVVVYGGFAGTETKATQRNPTTNVTILSGAAYCLNVVVIYQGGTGAVLDGFTITAGNASGGTATSSSNGSQYYGAGVYINGNGSVNNASSPVINNCIFSGNAASYGGGAICIDGSSSGKSNPIITNCIFKNNTATTDGGGAIYINADAGSCSPTIVNCLFYGNKSSFLGGAVYTYGLDAVQCSPSFINCTFSANTSTSYGGAAFNNVDLGTGNPIFTNCIFWADVESEYEIEDDFTTSTVTYSDIDPSNSGWSGTGSNNISSSPTFKNASVDSFELKKGSPAIDAGNNSAVPAYSTTDLQGVTRIIHTTVDMGAYEYIPPPTGNITSTATSICAGNNTNITGTVTATGGWTLALSPTGSATGTGNGTFSISVSPTTTTTYTIASLTDAYSSATSSGLTGSTVITVNPVVTPSFSISANPSGTICSGTSVTFTAGSVVNGGTTPTYQWIKNGSNVTGTGNTYTDATLNNSDSIRCVLTSNAACPSPSSVNSNEITMSVTTKVTPTISISPNPTATTCSGTVVNFTIASQTNQGTSPTYQWKKGSTVVSTSTTYSDPGTTGGSITCVLTSNASCVTSSTATSTATTLSITSPVTPTISISPNPTVSTCSGTAVNFTIASQSNQGASPTYAWFKGASQVGTGTTYSDPGTTGGSITCVLTSNASCVTSTTATSTATTLTVNSNVTPTISISPNPTVSTCSGTAVNFTIASQSNQGTSPTYAWFKGASQVGTGTAYSDPGTTGGSITCVLTSNASCVTSSTATSTATTLSITSPVTPTISISPNPTVSTCSGTAVNFTIASQTNQGTSPTYAWFKGASQVGTGTTYSDPGTTGGSITCVLTSNASCVTSTTATSTATTLTVNSNVTPTISISPNPTVSTCSGTAVNFTIASQSNQGASPTYAWFKGASQVGTGTTYSDPGTTGGSITCVLTSNASCVTSTTATSTATTLTVNSNVTPTISISPNPTVSTCSGTAVNFSIASQSNQGASPTYAWFKGASQVGTGTTYSDAGTTGGSITCVLTSNASCLTSSTATSTATTLTVNSNVTPTISISPNPTVSTCSGTAVNFSIASQSNQGASPTYAWFKGASQVGTGTTYSDAGTTGGSITCVLTSNASCVTSTTATSTATTLTVNSNVTPTISISPNPTVSTCSGTAVNFTIASQSNQGASPTYAWFKGASQVGTGSTYSDPGTTAGSITCVLTSNASCLTSSTATSTATTLTVNSNVTPTISISPNPTVSTCSGTAVNFSIASQSNQGASPTYAWFKGASQVGTGTTYSDPGTTGGSITCVLTSNASCVTSATATSIATTLTVNSNVTPTISISPNPTATTCSGTAVNFTITSQSNQGASPTYAWFKGASQVGTGTTYSDPGTTGGSITCVLTSNASCVTSTTATSTATTLSITSPVTPTISISPSPSISTCSGTAVNFTIASQSNQGASPTYAWFKGASQVGTGTTYSDPGTTGGSITCVLTSNASCVTSSTATSTATTLSITSPVTPTISISPNPTVSTCSGTAVNFSIASQSNQGTSPTYAWFKGASQVGTGTTYSDPGTTGGSITCVLTSNASCVTSTTATSTATTLTVNSNVTPTISISPNPTATTCSGTAVNFTIASQSNQGASPTYAWFKGASQVGTGTTYSDPGTTGGSITCVLTSNASCVTSTTATSTATTLTVNSNVTPTISISPNPTVSTCSGTAVNFSIASQSNQGTSPTYAWFKGASQVGTSSTYSDPGTTGGSITCVLTSNASCVTSTTATSIATTLTVNSNVTPTISINANPGSSIVSGTSVTFTANITNGGANPAYQWKKNNINVGTNSSTYTDAGLNDGDVITCVLTSNANCVTTSTATAGSITMSVASSGVCPTISVAPAPALTQICSGTPISYSISPVAGTSVYQWQYTNGSLTTPDDQWHNFGGNSASANLSGITQKAYVRVVLIAPGCATVSSRTAALSVDSTLIGITASNITRTSAVLGWNSIQGATYKITVNGTIYNSNTNSYALTGLSACHTYAVTIVANNATCGGIPSGAITFNTLAQPLSLTLSAGTGTSIVANWSAGVGPYKLYYGEQVAQQNLTVVNVTGTSYTIPAKNVLPGNSYIAYVVDEGSACTPKAQSPHAYYTTQGGSCTAPPPVITSVTSTITTFTITWTGNASTYQVYYNTGGANWSSYNVTGNSYTIKGAAPGTCYNVFITNRCGNTFGASSLIDTICVPGECTNPLNLELSQATCKGFTATWNTVADASTYEVYCSVPSNNGTPWLISYAKVTNACSFKIFQPNTTVTVYIKSNCANGGLSTSSNIESVTTLSTGCKDAGDIAPESNTSNTINTFSVYPNPNTGTFKVAMYTTSANLTGTIEVMDLLGRLVYSTDVTNYNGTISENIDLGNIASSGIYMVRVHCGNDIHITKVEIQK